MYAADSDVYCKCANNRITTVFILAALTSNVDVHDLAGVNMVSI